MKEEQYIRFIELVGISITRKEYEGVKLFMEIEELIQETEKAFCSLKEIISDYSAREENAKLKEKNKALELYADLADGKVDEVKGQLTRAKEIIKDYMIIVEGDHTTVCSVPEENRCINVLKLNGEAEQFLKEVER